MITLINIRKAIGARVLFDDVSMSFLPGNRYALTGPNGAGKSTLMKILMGEEDPSSGQVSLPKKVGYLRQNIDPYLEFRVLDVVIMGNKILWKALERREQIWAAEEITDELGEELGELEDIVMQEDGYEAEIPAKKLLRGMGIGIKNPDDYEKKLWELPQEQRFKVMLCQALFGSPEALLLDEPTNHLDLDSINWLEGFLIREYQGTLVVVSHDRYFLNSVATHVADIDYETIIQYPGNYDMMVCAKTSAREMEEKEAGSRLKKIAQLQVFVAKFSAGTRASQVQSRMREIENLTPEAKKRSNIVSPYFLFEENPAKIPGHNVLEIKKLSKQYENGPTIMTNFSCDIMRGDHIGVIGKNGAGKSTFVKMLAGVLTPTSGMVKLGHNVQAGYFAQEHSELIEKSMTLTAYDYVHHAAPKATDSEIRGTLGKLLFSGEDQFKATKLLSGGETARLILGSIAILTPNLLILDEPNGHLDLEAVSALAVALEKFPGTVILVSHDRGMISKVAKKIIAFEDDGPIFYDGTYEEYLDRKASRDKKGK